MPHLVQVAAEARQRGGQVLGISQDLFLPEVTQEQALAKVQAFVQKRKIPFPMFVLDDESLDGLSERYDLPGPIPMTLALDATGREVDRQEGGADEARLREMMRRALGELPPADRPDRR
jgi:hypothetical protein